MGFFALVALGTSLGPLVFEVSPAVERLLTVVEWVLVGAFAADFFVQGRAAHFSAAWRRSPWRIVDIITVLGPVVALLPQVSDLARGSLMLRMLRVVRAVAFGTRAGTVAVRDQRGMVPAGGAAVPTVTVLKEGETDPIGSDWNSFLAWTREPGESWGHASNLDSDHFRELASAAGMPDQDLDQFLSEYGYAKFHDHERYATLILQIPTVAEQGFPVVHRDRLLAIITDRGLLTAAEGSFGLQRAVASRRSELPKVPFTARIVCAILSLTQERYGLVAQQFEKKIHPLEKMGGGPALLRTTFNLRQEISTVALDLWHMEKIVHGLADGKYKLRGVDLRDEKYLDELQVEVESLHKTFDKNKEELKTLIELRINFKSFEMNAFLRLLAVVSALGLIPTVVGGLLGMNLVGNPWPVTLGQVAFCVVMGMATTLYLFAVKGWLK